MVRFFSQLKVSTKKIKSHGEQSLDGTNGAYYFGPGSGNNAQKWVFMLELGSYCEDEADCISRSQVSP
jgi:hypothetical protein